MTERLRAKDTESRQVSRPAGVYLRLSLGLLDCLMRLLVVLFEKRVEANRILLQHLLPRRRK